MPVMAVFGIAFGAVAVQDPLSLLDATLMSALVFAGASQFMAVELWTASLDARTVAAVGLVTATINMRFVLMGTSLRPWLGAQPARRQCGVRSSPARSAASFAAAFLDD
jgi:predicted branched-subunit amino acid permease